jgi:chromosome partitioning protein
MLIAVAHQKGGCSKTTLAFNLAVELKATHCYDLDFAKGGTTGLSFLDKLRQKSGHDCLNVTPLHTKNELISVVESDSEEQLIILDLGGLDSDINRVALAYADLIVTPANDSALEIGGLTEFARILADISKQTGNEVLAHVVAARTNYARKQWPTLSAICEQHESLVFSQVAIPLYVDFSDSLSEGLSVSEYNQHGNAALHMQQVIKYIKNILF